MKWLVGLFLVWIVMEGKAAKYLGFVQAPADDGKISVTPLPGSAPVGVVK